MGSRFSASTLLFLSLCALAPLKPQYGPGPVFPPGPVTLEKYGFAFDVPAGHVAEKAPDIDEYWIGPRSGGIALTVKVDSYPFQFKGPLPNPTDTLLSYVKDNFGRECGGVGPGSFQRADRLLSMRRFRSRRGLEAIEFNIHVLHESSRGAYQRGQSLPSQEIKVDSLQWVTGPMIVVDVSRPGKRIVVWVASECDSRITPDDVPTARATRAVASSIRLH